MPCNCQQEYTVEQATGKKVLIIYNTRNAGKHMVTGSATKQSYGYRKGGDRFEVYEADMRVRPDLFRPVNPIVQPKRVVAMRSDRADRQQRVARIIEERQGKPPGAVPAPPPPPPPEAIDRDEVKHGESVVHVLKKMPDNKMEWPIEELDWSKTKVNAGHIKLLKDNGINKLSDLDNTSQADLLRISGVGPATVRSLYSMKSKYDL